MRRLGNVLVKCVLDSVNGVGSVLCIPSTLNAVPPPAASVPPTNNAAERAGRRYKRKMAEVMCFRSLEGSARYCDGLSILESIKASGMNLYEGIQERFER